MLWGGFLIKGGWRIFLCLGFLVIYLVISTCKFNHHFGVVPCEYRVNFFSMLGPVFFYMFVLVGRLFSTWVTTLVFVFIGADGYSVS